MCTFALIFVELLCIAYIHLTLGRIADHRVQNRNSVGNITGKIIVANV